MESLLTSETFSVHIIKHFNGSLIFKLTTNIFSVHDIIDVRFSVQISWLKTKMVFNYV